MKPVSVSIVEPVLTRRLSLANRLGAVADFNVVGAFASLQEAIAAVQVTQAQIILFDDMEWPGWGKIDRPGDLRMLALSGLFDRLLDDQTDCFRTAVAQVRQAVEKCGCVPMVAPGSSWPVSKVIAIGASTGGVDALGLMLSRFPPDCPPTLVVLHMVGHFTASFAARMDRYSAACVREAQDGERLRPGHVLIAPGGQHHLQLVGHSQPRCALAAGDPVSGHRPSVDVMFHSLATRGAEAIGVLLTGMGKDGARGLLEIRRAGGRTFAQDEESCVVYGMPGTAVSLGAVQKQLPIAKMAAQVLAQAGCQEIVPPNQSIQQGATE